jgi:HK97 family phage portal protein
MRFPRLRLVREEPERRSLQFPTQDLIDAFGVTAGYAGQRVTVKKALGIGPVWGAVSTISEEVGQLPLKIYRQVDEDGQKVEARTHRMWRVLHDKPNEYTPADRFWSTVTTHLLLWGNAYVLKQRNPSGVVEELWLLHPSEVVIRWDEANRDKTFLHQPGQLGVTERAYTTRDVLHIWGLSCNGIWGDSVISAAKNVFGTAMARDEFEGGFYARGAVLSGVIEHPGKLGRDGLKNLRESFNVIYGGSDRAHQTAALEEGAKFHAMSHPLRDLELVAARGMSATEIATIFRLPPNYLGGSSGDSLTYATVEMNKLDLNQRAVAPVANTIAKALSNDPAILPQGVLTAEFVLDALLRADAKTRAEVYATLFALQDSEGRRALSVDEIRALENRGAAVKEKVPEPPSAVDTNGNGNGQLPREALDAVVSKAQ